MLTPARLPKRSPRRLRKFYAIIVKVFTPARVAKLADARDLKSRVPKGTYRFDSGPGHQVEFLGDPSLRFGISAARLRRRANASTRYGGRGEAGLTPFQCIQPMPQIAFTRKTRERAITVPLAIPDSLYLLKA